MQVAGCDGRKGGSFESRVGREECFFFPLFLIVVFYVDE